MIRSCKDLVPECVPPKAGRTPSELETQLIIAEKLGYLEKEKLNQSLSEMDAIGKMTRGLIKRLQK